MIGIERLNDITDSNKNTKNMAVDDVVGDMDNDKKVKHMEDMNMNTSKKEEELFTSWYRASPSNTLTTNAAFLYDSESDDSLPTLQGQYSVDTEYEHDQGSMDEDEDEEQDLIPLIHRITPPPPIYTDNIHTDDDNDDNQMYNEYALYHQDDDEYDDEDDELPTLTISRPSIPNLSIVIPSSLTLSKSSPIYDTNAKCSIFELCNTVTPISSDCDDENDENQNRFTFIQTQQSETDKPEIVEEGNNLRATEKTFNWNVPNNDDNMYVMNDYLLTHISSLIDGNSSD